MVVVIQKRHGNSNLIEESINPEDPLDQISLYVLYTYNTILSFIINYIRRLREFQFYTNPAGMDFPG